MPNKNKNHSNELEQRVDEHTKELQKSEAILRGFIDGSADAICIRDRDRRLILWNEVFARSIKTNCGIDVQAGMRAEDYIPEEEFAQFDEQRKLLYPAIDGESTQVEYAFPCKDGETRYFDVRWTPVRLGGEVIAVAEITRDITKQIIAQEELRRSDKRFRGYLQSSTEAIWGFEIEPPMPMDLTIDAQLDYLYDHARIVVANDAWTRQAGYNHWEEIIGLRLDEIVPRSDPENEAAIRQLAESNYHLEDFITDDLTKQGELQIVLNNHYAEIKNGHLTRTWGTHRDITALKKAEEELRKKDKLLEDAQRIAHLGSWNWNIITNELVWSDEVYRIFGFMPQEFGATYEIFLEKVHPDDREEVKAAVDQALNDPDFEYNIAHRIVVQNGTNESSESAGMSL